MDSKAAPLPRWVLLAPLLVSLALIAPQLVGLETCAPHPSFCNDLEEALTWAALVFPHNLIFPLIAGGLGLWWINAILLGLDLVVVAIVWLTQPPRVTWKRASVALVIWIAVSAVTAYFDPNLIAWAIHHRR